MSLLILVKTEGIGTAESWILETGTGAGSDNAGSNGFGIDNSGNVYYTGFIIGTNRDMTFAKVTPQGSLDWARALSGAADNNGQCSAIDSSGNFYACGSTAIDPPNDALIAKYDTSGTFQWQRKFGDDAAGQAGTQFFGQLVVDDNGDIILGGNAYEGAQVAGRGQDAIMAKYNSSGTVLWQYGHASSGTDNESINGMATDSSNNIYIVGASGTNYGMVAKLNSSGVIQWQRSITYTPGTDPDSADGVAVDGSGNVYVVGFTRDGAVFGGTSDAYAIKYDSSGVLQWQRVFGDSQYNNASDVALDSSGNLFVLGSTVVGGSTSAFVCKLNSSGLLQWTRTLTHQNKNFFSGSIRLHESSGYMYILGSQNTLTSGTSNNHLIARLPMDGSDTGTYSGIAGSQMFYASATYSEQAGSLTDAAGVLTTSNTTSYPNETPTLTDSDVSSSFDVSNLAELP